MAARSILSQDSRNRVRHDVDIRTVENCLSANEDELRHNGYFLCRGNSLKEFKLRFAHEIDFGSKTTQLGPLISARFLTSLYQWDGAFDISEEPSPRYTRYW